jgi:hypothetical protein
MVGVGHARYTFCMPSTHVKFIALLSLSAALGGCLYPTHGSVASPAESVMYINREPPPPRVELATTRRNVDEVWISGHWSANKNDYVWTNGHWALPENGKKEWEDGKWEHSEHGWRFVEGSWR